MRVLLQSIGYRLSIHASGLCYHTSNRIHDGQVFTEGRNTENIIFNYAI